ncbi:MAG: FUN14 domain-containing protein [Nitrososphaeraceae archaeon]
MVYESNTNTRRENTRQYRVVSNSKGVRWMNLNENLAVTVRGGFFGGILIGYALKKIIKIVTVIAGFFLAALVYLQYQQIANISWDRLQAISEDTLTTLANATQQIPGFDGYSNAPTELIMTNLGIPLTGSLAIGFTIGFMRG